MLIDSPEPVARLIMRAKTVSDIVMFLYRDDYYEKENSEKPGVCDVIIAKHRSGPTGDIELTWVDRYTRFSDMAN